MIREPRWLTMAGFGFFAAAFDDGDKKPETRHIKHQTPGPSVHQARDPKPYSLHQWVSLQRPRRHRMG